MTIDNYNTYMVKDTLIQTESLIDTTFARLDQNLSIQRFFILYRY